MLLEKLSNAMLDDIHILHREPIARGNLLRGDLKALAKNKDVEGATRYVMVCLEDLNSATRERGAKDAAFPTSSPGRAYALDQLPYNRNGKTATNLNDHKS